MAGDSGAFRFLPCVDSDESAAQRQSELYINRQRAAALGVTAFEAIRLGYYVNPSGDKVHWREEIAAAKQAKLSISPDLDLPQTAHPRIAATSVQVCNETTLQAARRLTERGGRPLALNFANGVAPGGGFMGGSRAQEEVLCRSSALYATLVGDPMYSAHAQRQSPDSTDWVILSPEVPVFRDDGGNELPAPWLLSFITSAAPYAIRIGQPKSGDLLQSRIERVLEVSAAYGYRSLVLGAWGCGAFGNDPVRTAGDFHQALTERFGGWFDEVVFAITDWSPERKTLGPFRDRFSAEK